MFADRVVFGMHLCSLPNRHITMCLKTRPWLHLDVLFCGIVSVVLDMQTGKWTLQHSCTCWTSTLVLRSVSRTLWTRSKLMIRLVTELFRRPSYDTSWHSSVTKWPALKVPQSHCIVHSSLCRVVRPWPCLEAKFSGLGLETSGLGLETFGLGLVFLALASFKAKTKVKVTNILPNTVCHGIITLIPALWYTSVSVTYL